MQNDHDRDEIPTVTSDFAQTVLRQPIPRNHQQLLVPQAVDRQQEEAVAPKQRIADEDELMVRGLSRP